MPCNFKQATLSLPRPESWADSMNIKKHLPAAYLSIMSWTLLPTSSLAEQRRNGRPHVKVHKACKIPAFRALIADGAKDTWKAARSKSISRSSLQYVWLQNP